jgi:hypothetical protein
MIIGSGRLNLHIRSRRKSSGRDRPRRSFVSNVVDLEADVKYQNERNDDLGEETEVGLESNAFREQDAELVEEQSKAADLQVLTADQHLHELTLGLHGQAELSVVLPM